MGKLIDDDLVSTEWNWHFLEQLWSRSKIFSDRLEPCVCPPKFLIPSWLMWNLFLLGLQRGYSEDAVEADELIMTGPSPDSPPSKLKHKPSRPPRRGSLSRNATYDKLDSAQMNGTLEPGIYNTYQIIKNWLLKVCTTFTVTSVLDWISCYILLQSLFGWRIL
jgi:hypothetical protein